MAAKRLGGDVNMTTGSVARHLIRFALPLLLGNLLQQLYNMVDTWVVGNFVSNEAFSAVGSVGPIINTLIGFFMGLSSGAGVVISQHYGAKQPDAVRRAVHTALVMTAILGVLFTGAGLLMTPAMLHLMKSPDNVFPEARAYLTIYFSGIITVLVYNMGAGILRAVGDSRRPFIFLGVCALLNIALDLTFVLAFHMGVEGVALATILSQGVSALLVIVTLRRADSWIHLDWKSLRIDWPIFRSIFRIGIPAALQMALTAFSNVFVQSYINHFGTDCMAGWTSYTKVDQLIFLPMQSIGLASTTFVGQNLGCAQVERARRGVRTAELLALGCTAVLVLGLVIPAAPVLAAFFNNQPEVVEISTMFLRYISPFYLFCTVNQVYGAALRGSGRSQATMFIMLGSFVVFRQIYLYVMSHWISNTILPIAMGYPAGWILCSTLTLIYFHCVDLSKNPVVQ